MAYGDAIRPSERYRDAQVEHDKAIEAHSATRDALAAEKISREKTVAEARQAALDIIHEYDRTLSEFEAVLATP